MIEPLCRITFLVHLGRFLAVLKGLSSFAFNASNGPPQGQESGAKPNPMRCQAAHNPRADSLTVGATGEELPFIGLLPQ